MTIHIAQKLRIGRCNLQRVRLIKKYLTKEAAATIVQALVISHLDYGNALFYKLPDKIINKLQVLQNDAAKVVLFKKRSSSSTDARRELHWLPIRARIEFKIIMSVFKCVTNRAPDYLKSLLEKKLSCRTTRSMSNNAFAIPRTKAQSFADRSFSVSGPQLWNALPEQLKEETNLECFKTKLKTHLFRKYYPDS